MRNGMTYKTNEGKQLGGFLRTTTHVIPLALQSEQTITFQPLINVA